GLSSRSFGPLCDNLGSEEIELVQHRQITAQARSTIRLSLELVNRHLLRLPLPRTRGAFPRRVWESKSSRSSDRRLRSSPFSRAGTRRSHGVICDRCFHRVSRPIRDRFRAVRRSTPKAAPAWCPERKWRGPSHRRLLTHATRQLWWTSSACHCRQTTRAILCR